MTERLKNFDSLVDHPWFKKLVLKLSASDKDMITKFIAEKDHLTKADFEFAINRIFLDKKDKPKKYKEILDVLCCVNSMTDSHT